MAPLPFSTRLWFAWVCFFKVLFDGAFAARAYAPQLAPAAPAVPTAPPVLEATKSVAKVEPPKVEPPKVEPPRTDAALQLLALFQREGRFVDFLEEDVASFSDADIGAAARVVHAGCKKALHEHVKLEPVRMEEEGTKVTLETSPAEVKLTGNVAGAGPYRGTLRHRGWRATDVTLPIAIAGHDAHIVAQAEVEL